MGSDMTLDELDAAAKQLTVMVKVLEDGARDLKNNLPTTMRWRDASIEAPPKGLLVLAWHDGAPNMMRYEGDNGQDYRRLPNPECWGYWYVSAGPWSHNSYETTMQVRHWMPLPTSP